MLGRAFDRIDDARGTARRDDRAEVDAQLLAAASLHDRVTLDAHLLLEERIMYAQHRRDRVFYSFRHALIRDAAYASMPPACANHARVSQLAARKPIAERTRMRTAPTNTPRACASESCTRCTDVPSGAATRVLQWAR